MVRGRSYPRVELVVVMILVPLFVNVLQFWIQVRLACLTVDLCAAVCCRGC